MARFSDLPYELQAEIWQFVLPGLGGAHWVELEGLVHPPQYVKTSLERYRDLFHGREPTADELWRVREQNANYDEYYMNKINTFDESSPFFEMPYIIVPSALGQGGQPRLLDEQCPLSQDLLEEIAQTRRCRQLSTYTQIATILSTCQISRKIAEEYLLKIEKTSWIIWRGFGTLSRPRSIDIWEQQYRHIVSAPEVPRARYRLETTIKPAVDLLVLRLHTVSGHPTQSLTHFCYQMNPENNWTQSTSVGWFPRVGLEWHPVWATDTGVLDHFRPRAVDSVISLISRGLRYPSLYLLVDGIPRPRWRQYPSIIPELLEEVMEIQASCMFESSYLPFLGNSQKALLEDCHNLNQEFEANGRRYFVVFVVGDWSSYCHPGQPFEALHDSVKSGSLFPGGEDLWPKALRDPVRFAYRRNHPDWPDRFSIILSWEEI